MADLDKNGDENNMMSRAIATDDDADRCRAVVATVILVGSGAFEWSQNQSRHTNRSSTSGS